jgi:hypothetical protein
MHVFVSHSRVNSSAALRLCGVATWLDTRDLLPGTDWGKGVSDAIETAAGFVFVIGPAGSADQWQTFEWQQIVNNEYYLDPTKCLIPVLIGDPELPGFLKTRRTLVLGDTPDSYEEVAAKVVSTLENPADSVDREKLELGRQARQRALKSFQEYSLDLEKEDIKRAGIRAIK